MRRRGIQELTLHATALVLVVATAACTTSLPVERLPTWEAAHAGLAASAVTNPTTSSAGEARLAPCFDQNRVDASELPDAVPYAIVSDSFDGDLVVTAKRLSRSLHEETAPDFTTFHDLGTYETGSVSQFWGNGLATERRIYARAAELIAWRLLPAQLGFELRARDGVALRVPPSDRFEGEALLEGDEVLSMNSTPVRPGERWFYSPHWRVLLETEPGEALSMVWLRPGAGRMAGQLRAAPPKRSWPALPALF